MSGLNRSLEYMAGQINMAEDTKKAVINAAHSYENIQKRVKEIAEKAMQEEQKQEVKDIHLNPNEINHFVNRGSEPDNGEGR